MAGIDLEETIRRLTFPDEVWEWFEVLGDALVATEAEAARHEDITRDTSYKDLLVRTINKDINSLSAVYVLLRFECIHQAAAHVRLLCDSLITLRYIGQNPEVRAKQFLGFADIEAYQIGSAMLDEERARAKPHYVRQIEEFLAVAKVAYEEAKGQYEYLDRQGKKRLYNNWCNKQMSRLASECGNDMARLYKVVFRQLSAYVHGSAWSLRRQIAYSGRHYKPEVVLNDVAQITRTALVVWVDWARFCDEQLSWNLLPATTLIVSRLNDLDARLSKVL